VRYGSFFFSGEWLETVRRLPETGMGYTVATIRLKDGRVFERAVIDSGCMSRIRGRGDIPFHECDIAAIKVTHDKWDWREP
jgi:hypothetical protein